jgi:hypothetical protein
MLAPLTAPAVVLIDELVVEVASPRTPVVLEGYRKGPAQGMTRFLLYCFLLLYVYLDLV